MTTVRTRKNAAGTKPIKGASDEYRYKLYLAGYTDGAIAEKVGVGCRSICDWRKARSLPAHAQWAPQTIQRKNVTSPRRVGGFYIGDALYQRISKAVGRKLPPQIADDTIQNMYVDVLSGKIAPEEIEALAYRYGTRTMETYWSYYAPRSLDDYGDFKNDLYDRVADDRHSAWLEEMGASFF